MVKAREAHIRFPLTTSCAADGLGQSLGFETRNFSEEKYSACIFTEDNIISMNFEASNTHNLRVALCNYLRWAIMLRDIHEIIEEFK